MVLKDEEGLDLIQRPLITYVPNSMDRINALEKLDRAGTRLFTPPSKCPQCGKEMVCLECEDVDIDIGPAEPEVTVRLGNRTIHAN